MNRLVLSIFLVAMLAGCASTEPDAEEFVEKEGFEHESGKGAIAGLIVDDRFRPIELGDAASTDFQAIGFVLLQETGQEIGTTENGEFTFVNLNPGEYILRAQSADHEGTPMKVLVKAGEFTDVTMQMQRKVSDSTTILTQEYSIFIDCYANAPGTGVWWTELNCFLDMSLDSKRGGFQTDYSKVPNITYMVSEYLISQSGDYEVNVGYAEGESISEEWASGSTGGGDYAKIIMATPDYYEGFEAEFDGMLQSDRQFLTYVNPGDEAPPFEIAVEAQIIQTVWLGEPEEDIFTYCVLCPQ